MRVDLTGKRVLVTGASRGIGHALARHLHAAGAEVLIHFGRQEQAAVELARTLGERAHPVQMDLSKLDTLSTWFTDLRERFGPIHALVNNAGVAHAVAMEAEEAEWLGLWEHTFQVNVGAVALLCKAFIRHAIADGHAGRIVNIASRAGFRGDTPEYLAYGASKGCCAQPHPQHRPVLW
ncbi:SDR family NAD(P)-dependent oxidoreductase [Nitritalea halalkaliphila]|uniref:SDR family NAD(P)-dependent oxidoreductase n=1 Tax=Nitritalea halalkaliphila TaxID=590849 RepID=UPI0003161EE7|nr:SDR family NAD(P)-dependent oxidoreductase [Nitritalea halalkaliphila]